MKLTTSLLLSGSVIAAGYQYLCSMAAAHRLAVRKYKIIPSESVWDATKKLHVSPDIMNGKAIFYEFDDVIIMALDDDDMKKVYEDKVIKKYLPSFVK